MISVASTGSALFAPLLNVPAGIAEIAGRQSFHEAESDAFVWLRADPPTFLSARQYRNDFRDHRYLSVALATVAFFS